MVPGIPKDLVEDFALGRISNVRSIDAKGGLTWPEGRASGCVYKRCWGCVCC